MLWHTVMHLTAYLPQRTSMETALYDHPREDTVPIMMPVPNTLSFMHQDMKILYRRFEETEEEPDEHTECELAYNAQ